jgi:hypothetical protein
MLGNDVSMQRQGAKVLTGIDDACTHARRISGPERKGGAE